MIRLLIGAVLIGGGVWLAFLPLPTLMSGLCLMGFGLLFLADFFVTKRRWKKGWKWAIRALGAGVFLTLSLCIAAISLQGRSEWEPARRADYAVVLGAQIWGEGPSLILQQRLEAALRFLEENPKALVIVSGGQGPDEVTTEASVMAGYLLSHGAEPDRVFREEAATNTRENLIHSAKIAQAQGCHASAPVIITSEFHMARAKYIAKNLGLTPVGISSRTQPFWTKANALVREVFAFGKAWFLTL